MLVDVSFCDEKERRCSLRALTTTVDEFCGLTNSPNTRASLTIRHKTDDGRQMISVPFGLLWPSAAECRESGGT